MTIQDAIEIYKQHYQKGGGLAEELYKWELLTKLQGRPNLDAENFYDEIYELKFGNLVYGPQTTAIRNLAKYQPEGYREAFRALFDETTDLQMRITAFMDACDSLWDGIKYKFDKSTSSMVDERLIAAFLACKYPEKYTFYKNDIYSFVCQLTGQPKEKAGHKLAHYYELLNTRISPIVAQDIELNKSIETELDSKHLIHSTPLVPQTVMWYVMSKKKWGQPSATSEKPRVWLYAPGENASYWQECIAKGIMAIDWKEMGDLSKYTSLDNVKECAKEIYEDMNSWSQSGLAIWQFVNDIQIGDIVIAKDGRRKLVGMGKVTGDYQYDESVGSYPNVRKVNWIHIGNWNWDKERSLPLKTLTRIEDSEEEQKFIDDLIATFDSAPETPEVVSESESDFNGVQYWWLVGKPKIFKFSDIAVGETEEWTMYTENGTKRRIFQNFLDAKVGDKVICYQATPMLQIVALGEISRENDGQTLQVKKTENLLNPIDYAEIKGNETLANMEFLKNGNGSFFKLTPEEAAELMEIIRADNPVQKVEDVETYIEKDFLKDVFMDEPKYQRLCNLLKTKKNIILQGAPGVGKTYTAKRLVYSLIGKCDDRRVEVVQFHQNYSYEDFIMGYKPADNGGFELRKGIFFSFCERARNDKNHDYYFIIDEINRGNLSKIFGELLMLIESGYRDKEIRLSNRGETFSVPKNLYLIGMMNTADRSLALIDYALRRRFSFFEITPGFDTDGFKDLQIKAANEKFDKLIEVVKSLNKIIESDDSLGSGFCIGHSYFCEVEKHLDNIDAWLENIVDYDIDPMLREYWFDNRKKYESEIAKIRTALK